MNISFCCFGGFLLTWSSARLWGPRRRAEGTLCKEAEVANVCKGWRRKDGNSFCCSLMKYRDQFTVCQCSASPHLYHLPHAGLKLLMVVLRWREENMLWCPYTCRCEGSQSMRAGTEQTLGMQQSPDTMARQTSYCIFPLEARRKRGEVCSPCLLEEGTRRFSAFLRA